MRQGRMMRAEQHRGDTTAPGRRAIDDLIADVRYYLAQRPRQLPSKYFYDDLGSALFDAITQLPWYPLTRAETRLIRAHGRDILDAVDADTIVELGPGNGTKLAMLLSSRRAAGARVGANLVDVSPAALARAARTVRDAGCASIGTYVATYEEGLARLAPVIEASTRTLVVFFGSNIGNFDPPGCRAFLNMIRTSLRPGDALLLGADLVKPEPQLLLAYDDPLGVTAAFNRNLLVRLNRDLGATIDASAFDHRAVWNRQESRVEMHLVSNRPSRVTIPVAEVDFTVAAGDVIWTESSYKYEKNRLERMLCEAAPAPASSWIDETDRFALTLAHVTAGGQR